MKMDSIDVWKAAISHVQQLIQETKKEQTKKKKPVAIPVPDKSTLNWQKRNPWWGKNDMRTGYALGVHGLLEKLHGAAFVGTPKYWREVDKEMQRRFPRMRKKKK
jgi:hypothetical protein